MNRTRVNRIRMWKQKIIAGIAMLLCFVLFAEPCMVVGVAGETDTSIYFSVEAFTIGQGYVVEPMVVPNGAGLRVDDVIYMMLGDRVQKPKEGYYLSVIKNADNGTLQIPEPISEMEAYGKYLAPSNEVHDENRDYPDLGEFSYSPMAGWMYAVNGLFPSKSMHDYVLAAGDVLRVQFTLHGYGADLGDSWEEGGITCLSIAKKEELTKKLADINEKKTEWMRMPGVAKTYESAMDLAADLTAEQDQIDLIIQAFPEKLSVSGNETEPTKPGQEVDPKDEDPGQGEKKEEQTKDDNDDKKQESTKEEEKEKNPSNPENGGVKPQTNPQVSEGQQGNTAGDPVVNPEMESKQERIAKVKWKSAISKKKKQVTVTWKKISNVDGVIIYRATSKKGAYKKIKKITSKKVTSYIDKKVKRGCVYYYKIRAYKKVGKTIKYGSMSSIKKVKVK